MKTHFIGDCYVFGGDPTTAGGMTYYGDLRGRVSVTPGVEIATGRVDRFGRAPISDGIYVHGPAPVVSVPFVEEAKDNLAQHLLGATKVVVGSDEALLFAAPGLTKIDPATLPTLLLLPKRAVADYPANLADDPEAWWIPCAIPAGSPEFGFELPEGDDIFSPHEVQFIGAVRETDQAGTTIPEGAQVIFKGSATAAGLAGWTVGMPTPANLAAALS